MEQHRGDELEEVKRRLMECEDLLVDLWQVSAYETIRNGQKTFITGGLSSLEDTFKYLQLHGRINANGVPIP